jgi:hypothetical protein
LDSVARPGSSKSGKKDNLIFEPQLQSPIKKAEMKRGILLVIILAILGFLGYKFFFDKDDDKGPKPEPMVITGSDSLTTTTAAALQAYYELKDAFVKSDTSLVNQTAPAFVAKLDAIQLNAAQADTALMELAGQLRQTIGDETRKIPGIAALEDKRRTFQVMSDQLYDFLRTIRYSGSKVYQQFCPMAFDNTGAAWLSNSTEVVNPYFGDKMLHCGEVRDSLRTMQ